MDATEQAAKRGYEAWRMALSGWGEIPEWVDLKGYDRYRWMEAATAILGVPPEPDTGSNAAREEGDFGKALEALRAGHRVRRAGWNGKGMWLALQPGYPEGVPANATSAKAFHVPEGTTIRILPYIVMKTVDGSFVPWLASQTDVLAQDWAALE